MTSSEFAAVDGLRKEWTDKYVRLKPGLAPEWKRFEGRVGRVVTVNLSGRALVDFCDGGWYDLANFAELLEEVTDPEQIKQYNAAANSAQPLPARQA